MSETHNVVPHHIAIIPDGNRRWAKAHGLEPWKGHEEGSKRFEDVSEAAFEAGVNYVTFWAASEDNLKKRPTAEVTELLRLIKNYLSLENGTQKFIENKIRIRVLGRWQELLPKVMHPGILEAEQKTAHFTEHNLTILLGYDGQSEMLAALNHLAVTKQAIDAATLRAALWTADLPPVDLVIRSGGEPHWSAGFMMWHVANSQLYFTEELWPDFAKTSLNDALLDYASRQRRLGA
jgi:undecaprenyl diphosphate synthase